MPGIAHFLESGFKARNRDGKLLLPDLSALANTTIGIFSDYGGERTGKYLTYSFLVCAFGSLDPFKIQMAKLRNKANLGEKEIAFKSFKHGPLHRMLPDYLQLVDSYVSGLVFTLVVDRQIPSLLGPAGTASLLVDALAEQGYGRAKPDVAEKLFRIIHTIAFLIALLAQQGQKLFWMTDHDAISETPERHERLLHLLNRVLPLYTTKTFGLLGGALPFKPRATEYLDLLSLADVAAGATAECLTGVDTVGLLKAQVKDGADHVLRWLCYDSVTLKKLCIMVKRDADGHVVSGPVNFEPVALGENEIFVPAELVRS